MKKLVIAAALLGLGTQVAHATKARLTALGQDKDGSLFIQDSRNIFRNASYVSDMAGMTVIEFGRSAGAAGTSLDSDTAQKAEGGAFMKVGSLVYGIYLGNESDTGVLLKSLPRGAASAAMPQSDNVLELSVAGSAGINWGATFGFAPSKDETTTPNKENKSVYARLGVNKDKWEAYANVSISGESDNGAGEKYDGGGAYDVGGSYKMGMNTLYARYKTVEWDQIAASVKTKGDYKDMKVGFGHNQELSSSSRMIYQITYDSVEANVKYAAGNTKGEFTQIPLVVGFEADANSWLTLRGSVSHNLMGDAEVKNVANVTNAINRQVLAGFFKSANAGADYKGSIQNSTNVNAGATLTFGNLNVDGVIGTGGNSGTATTTAAETGTLSLDRLMTRVSMTYKF